MRDQREQILFVVVLLIVGWLSYSRFDALYTRAAVRSAGQLAAVEVVAPPRVRLDVDRSATGPATKRGRSLFAPPRELEPLAPVSLADPPVPELALRRPAITPSMQGRFARVYRIEPEAMGQLHLPEDASSTTSVADAPVAPVGAGASSTGASVASSRVDEPTEAPDPKLVYDWIQQVGLSAAYGYIKNADPHGLRSRSGEAIVFQQVSERSGKPIGFETSFERSAIEAFGLARTFENEAIEKSLALGSGVGSVKDRKELALELLESWPAEPQALSLAEAEAERAHAASGRDPATARLLAAMRRLGHDLEGELSLYVTAESEGWADAALYADHAALVRKLGLHDRALQLVDEAERLTSSSAETRCMRARLLMDEGRWSEALEKLEEVKTPFQPPFVDEQRRALTIDIATAQIALGQPEKTLRALEDILLAKPDHREALGVLVAAYAAAGRLDDASRTMADLLAVAPEHGPSLTNAAVLAWRQGDGESAERLALTARDVDPFHGVEPTLVLGFLHEDAGRLQQARDDYAEALRLDPGRFDALYRMGRAQRLGGDAEGASVTLKKALRLGSPEVLLLGELSLASLDQGRPDPAAGYCREALRLEPDNGRIRWLLGLALLLQGDVTGAREALEVAVASGQPGAHSALAVAHHRRGDETAALEHFDEVARAFAGHSDDSVAVYAEEAAASIRDNLGKRQWVDTFTRSGLKLQRGWEEHTWQGSPRVFLGAPDGAGVLVQGRVEKTRENERPGIQRPVEGRGFFSAEAVLTGALGHQGRQGVSLTYRQAKGVLGRMPKGQLDIWVGDDGLVRTSVLDGFDNLVVDGEVVPGYRVLAGQSIALGVERLDLVGGEFQFLVDGRRVGEPVVVKALRNFNKNLFDLEVYAEAAPGRTVEVEIELVRIVQEP